MATSRTQKTASHKRRDIEKTQRLLYHVPDAAFQLSLSPAEIWRRIASGDLQPTRVGKRVLISHAECMRFIEMNSADSARRAVRAPQEAIR